MKKMFAVLGAILAVLCSLTPASARSIKEHLQDELFAASQRDSLFLTVAGPNNRPIPLLSANPDPRRFGRPIQSGGGPGGISRFFTRGLASEILTESAVVPVPSGSSGFSYVFNYDMNTFQRKSIGLGSIFNERVSTLGARQLALGVTYVRQDFDEFNGEDLSDLDISSESNPFARQELGDFLDPGVVAANVDLDVTTNTVAVYAIYGLTERIDISFLLPITEISVRAKSRIFQGSPTFQENVPVFFPDPLCTVNRASNGQCRPSDFTVLRRGTEFSFGSEERVNKVDETRTGVGDLIMRAKARFLEGSWGAFGGLTEFTFPSGEKDNFLGDGAFKARFLLLYSLELFKNRLNFHVNGGGKVTTQTSRKDTVEYGAAVDLTVSPRISLAAELLGSWRVDSGGLPDHFVDGAFGFKYNPFGGLIVNASFRIPATDDGLRSDLVYLAGLEYDF